MNKQMFNRLALLFIVVALSGCVGQSGTSTGASNGVIIKRFAPDISEIFSEDIVTFSLSVENVGGEDATDVNARLFGLGTDWTFESASSQSIPGILERSQPEFKVPGGIGDAQWDLESPSGLMADNTYSASVRLSYGYKTTALANIKIYNNDYLRSNPDEAERIMRAPGIESFTITDAPIRVEFAGLARPLVKRGTEPQTASITILIDNTGQGKPYRVDLGTTEDENNMEVTILKVRAYETDCVPTDPNVRLPRAGKKSVSCTFDLPNVEEFTTIPVEVELSYRYFLDSTTSIKVLESLTA